MAAAILGRSGDDRYVRRWGSWAMRHLGADDPGRAVQELDERYLPDVLRAYARLHMQSAMRVIVSYVDSDRRGIRRAARWAIEQYGGNAIWILRTAYHNEVGEHAPDQWGWRRLAQELYDRADAERLAPVRAALEEGTEALHRGDLATMRERFDDVLSRAPELEDPAPVARGYAALGAARLDAGELDEARWAYRRALRLAPEDAAAAGWRAQLAYAEAEANRADGVLDVDAYRRVLAHDPEHAGAAEALEAAPTAPVAASRRSSDRTRWGLIAAALLGLLGMGLLWRGGSEDDVEEREPTCDTTLEAPTFDDADATLADQTLPG
jgi:tetratricopeptide (TPR) repeat protein